MAAISKVARQAVETFSKISSELTFGDNLAKLRSLVNSITHTDVCLDTDLLKSSELSSDKTPSPKRSAPATYIELWEDSTFSMGIFVLKSGTRIPLHDHPGMYGILKIIYGAGRLTSYSRCKHNTLPQDVKLKLKPGQVDKVEATELYQDLSIDTQGSSVCLDPDVGNYHELVATGGPLAFLDILAPPYGHDSDRECHYYRNITGTLLVNPEETKVHYLLERSLPSDFWCNSAPYKGPEINPYNINMA